jgi:hypothetical protein
MAALVLTAMVATALPAFGHASFPAATGFGFQPNTLGGTGAPGVTPPYPAGTTQTVYTRVPFEQTEPHNGSDDTTVDVSVVVPDGWTSPTCGAARKQINDLSTNNTNQPGATVTGWSCEVLTSGDNDVIHWSGPQVASPATAADSAQFFVFTVMTPSPAQQTTYNGLLGTEGFIVDQEYASGEIKHWIPDASFTGDPPLGSETIVAPGLARTVASVDDDCGPGEEGPFTDVGALHQFCDDINWMVVEGIAGGFGDGTFRPTNAVSRQAMASFLYKAAGEPTVTLADPFFADVPESHQFYDAIQWMAETELSTGTPNPPGDPLFNPTASSTGTTKYRSEPTPRAWRSRARHRPSDRHAERNFRSDGRRPPRRPG